MKSQIIKKLTRKLSSGLKAESDVVYLAAELRKIIEQQPARTDLDTLEFYLDWALHSALDRAFARRWITRIASLFGQMLFGHGLTNEEFVMLSGLLSFEEFRKQLSLFLIENDLPSSLCDDSSWNDFLRLYSCVIEDCPLQYSKTTSDWVFDKMVCTKQHGNSPAQFLIRWTFSKHGTTGSIQFDPRKGVLGSSLVLSGDLVGPKPS